jgi:hypothetical protein
LKIIGENKMQAQEQNLLISKKRFLTGRIMSILSILFLLLDSSGKLMQLDPVIKGTTELGYSENLIVPIGIILLICTIFYIIPRTSFLGAILLTGYLGGAVATNLRIENPLFSHILFPVYLGILIWGGLYLTNNKISAIIKNKY